MKIQRLLRTSSCQDGINCPKVFELADGRLAVQGDRADTALLAEAGVPAHESMVIEPRLLLAEV